MAYYYPDTGKEAIIREIHSLAQKTDRFIEFDPVSMLAYEDLVDLKHELINEVIQGDDFMGKGVVNAQRLLRKNKV